MATLETGVQYYTKEHEWIEFSDGIVTVGITDHAQESLGDMVYVGDLPKMGAKVASGDVIAVVESVKATSDVYTPIDGVIEEVNSDLEEAPETLNQDPHGDGWLVRIRVREVPEPDDFMDEEAYATFCQEG